MKKYWTPFLIGCTCWCLVFLTSTVHAQKNSEDITGTWLTQKKTGKVEIYKQGNYYFGKISWLKDPAEQDGKPKLDKNNPDAAKRNQPIVGLVIVKNLQWKGDGDWEEGKVYDPENGKTYSASVALKDINTLEFTGFIGLSFIGRTETWTRVK